MILVAVRTVDYKMYYLSGAALSTRLHSAWLTPTQTHPHVKTWTDSTKTCFPWENKNNSTDILLRPCLDDLTLQLLKFIQIWFIHAAAKEAFGIYWSMSGCKTFSVQLRAVQTYWSCRLSWPGVKIQAQPWNTLNSAVNRLQNTIANAQLILGSFRKITNVFFSLNHQDIQHFVIQRNMRKNVII